MDSNEASSQICNDMQQLLDKTYKDALNGSTGKREFVAVHHGGALVPVPNAHDLVFENIFVGGEKTARDIEQLKALNVTHVVNCSQGKRFSQVDTDENFYAESGLLYFGIPGHDSVKFDISTYFQPAADFVKEGCSKGRVYVHCHQGISRSTTIVLAYLIIHHGMTALEALRAVLDKRMVMPNKGFLKQLAKFQVTMQSATRPPDDTDQ